MPRLGEAASARFLNEDDGLPVLIFNLIRFDADTGPGRLENSLFHMRTEFARFGADVGEASSALWEEGDGFWDGVAIVRIRDVTPSPTWSRAPSTMRRLTACVTRSGWRSSCDPFDC